MTDRELLERAAKAAGIEGAFFDSENPIHRGIYQARGEYYWNPLVSDSEALRLAAKLHMRVRIQKWGSTVVDCSASTGQKAELHKADVMAATRRAIVRCAASTQRDAQ